MAYNTLANLRSALGMTATIPPDASITAWQVLVDNLIDGFNSTPNLKNASVIEYNRIAAIYNQTRKLSGEDKWKIKNGVIDPLSQEEKAQLNAKDVVEDTGVDAIPMNGKRWREVY